MQTKDFLKDEVKPSGESWVWVTSMGLGLGLTMIVFLLGMIFYNGVEVFWPKPVVRIELREGSDAGIKGSGVFGGEVVKIQERAVDIVGSDEGADQREYQVFVGNKDANGFSFKYVDFEQITAMTYPENVVLAERMEYGDAIFVPLSLKLADGTALDASDPQFESRLHELVNRGNKRRVEILKIERDEIGAINRDIEKIRLSRRGIEVKDEPSPADQARLAEFETRELDLQSRYQQLAAQARELRGEQSANTIVYATLDGQEMSFPTGSLIHFYYPNQVGFFQKLGLFFHGFWNFLSDEPREANTEGGIFPAIFGTFVMTLLMSLAVTPFGVLAAIYLREYAKQGPFVRAVRIAVNNLAGVPSIVFGVFGLGFFVYFVGGSIDQLFFSLSLPSPTFGTGGVLWAALTLALMTVPVVIVATEESLASVSRGIREASLACGASKWQTIQRIVMPASLPGILTGLILAMARGAGEVAPLMLVGVVKLAPTLPLDSIYPYVHLERKFMHLGFHIFDLGFQSPDSEAAKPMVFATTFLLILLVVCLNLGAILIRNHLRKKYKTSTF